MPTSSSCQRGFGQLSKIFRSQKCAFQERKYHRTLVGERDREANHLLELRTAFSLTLEFARGKSKNGGSTYTYLPYHTILHQIQVEVRLLTIPPRFMYISLLTEMQEGELTTWMKLCIDIWHQTLASNTTKSLWYLKRLTRFIWHRFWWTIAQIHALLDKTFIMRGGKGHHAEVFAFLSHFFPCI